MTFSKGGDEFRGFHLGWRKNSRRDLAQAVERRRERVHELVTNRPIGVNWWEVSRCLVNDHQWLCLWLFLLDRDKEAAQSAQELVKWAKEYFFGEWRNTAPSGNYRNQPPDARYHRQMAVWQDEYQNAAIWASVVDDWDAIEELSHYPTAVVRLDVDQSEENRAWLLTLAGILRGDQPASLAPHIEKVRKGRRKREKLLLDFLLAIHSTDQSAMADASSAYFRHYMKSERPRELITSKVAFDGTLLVNLARHRGLELPVPENAQPHLIRLNT